MADLVTTPLLAEKEDETPASLAEAHNEDWQPSAIVADIATLGTGTLLAGLINVVLVFVVPKLLSIEDYGYWRMFALYAGYVGFLHFGFADGLLLRWAGRPMEEFHHEIGPAAKYLFWQHVIVLVPLCAIAAQFLPGSLRFVGIGVAIYALIFNETTLLQFGLQSAKIFRPVAISMVAAPALFLAFVLLWRAQWQIGYWEVIAFYATGWLIVLIFLLAWARPWSAVRDGARVMGLAKACVLNGWPIVMANTGVMLIVYADRLAVSWAASIQNFAQYSLAASAMAAPIMAIQACSKVLFSHLAGVTPEGRKQIYGICSRTLLMAWAILLPYYFALDAFIRHFLPKYLPSLQYARILLLGIPFLAAIQILQLSYAYLNGMQKHFLAQTVVVLAVSIGITSLAAFHAGSLRIVAGVQVAILGAWWLFNEWTLRQMTGQQESDWTKFGFVYFLSGIGYWLAIALTKQNWISVLGYYVFVVAVLTALCGNELRVCLRLVGRLDSGGRQGGLGGSNVRV